MSALRKRPALLVALVIFITLGMAGWSCAGGESLSSQSPASTGASQQQERSTTTASPLQPGETRVRVHASGGKPSEVVAEIADDRAERSQGLMHRENLPRDRGMLFVYELEGNYAFWMKNTLIPLDMIFIDKARRVVGIVESAQPHTTEPRRVGVPSRYILEVNGGWAEEHQVEIGDRVDFSPSPKP